MYEWLALAWLICISYFNVDSQQQQKQNKSVFAIQQYL